MDSRKQDRVSEAVLHDFVLVTTYLPILGLTVRAKTLVCLIYSCLYTFRIPMAGVMMLCASLVYIDALLLSSHLDKSSGHLTLVALAVLTQQHARECSDAGAVALLISDLAWSVCTSAEVCSSVSSWRVHLPMTLKVVGACVCACSHIILACAPASMLEMIGRAVLFYVLCSLVVLCAPFFPSQERSVHYVLFVCAPVLFVHAYLVVASVLLLVGTHARLVYQNVTGSDSFRVADSKRSTNVQGLSVDIEQKCSQRPSKHTDSDLAAFLAAKRTHGLL
jgi:hypothetical protein